MAATSAVRSLVTGKPEKTRRSDVAHHWLDPAVAALRVAAGDGVAPLALGYAFSSLTLKGLAVTLSTT